MTHRKKLIEVALPLEAINEASAREKSIRHGHPSTLHLWWARRPLAAARAVIFASLVDDPDDPNALPAFVEACKQLPIGANVKANGDTPRMRLFDFIERLVTWEATTDEKILNTARELIRIATEGSPPPLLDPFAGGGSIPLEAQRLGLEAHASDLNPVAVMINKAQIEIPPRFANMPPVNPRDRKGMFAPPPPSQTLSPVAREGLPPSQTLPPVAREGLPPSQTLPLVAREGLPPSQTLPPQGGKGFTADTPDKWVISPELERRMQAVARELRKNQTPAEETLWQAIRKNQVDGRKFRRQVAIGAFVVDFYCASERLAVEVDGPIHDQQQEADKIRQELIESLGIRFVRLKNDEIERDLKTALNKIRAAFFPHPQSLPHQEGVTVSSPSLLVGEGAGGWGDTTYRGAAGLAADVRYYGEWMREKAWERIGHLYPKYTPHPKSLPQNEGGTFTSLPSELGEGSGMGASLPSELGEGSGMGADRGGETVIAWLWARTVKSPNPAVNAHVPLVRSFILSKKKGRECWAKPVVEALTPQPPLPQPVEERGSAPLSPRSVGEGPGVRGTESLTHTIRFEVTPGTPPKGQDGTVDRRGARCIISGEPIPFDYIRAEGKAGRMGAMLMAIVTEGNNGRSYYSPTPEHAAVAEQAQPEWIPMGEIPQMALGFRVQLYGMDEYNKLFTPRQLVALTTFSDLVHEAREQAYRDALAAGLPDDDPQSQGGGIPLREGGRGARAYAEAVSVYLAFAVDRLAERSSTIATWQSSADFVRGTFGRQAIPMVWDFAEVNPFSGSTGNFFDNVEWVAQATETIFWKNHISYSLSSASQQDAANSSLSRKKAISTDPPYYDNIGYADLSDFFYVWMRKCLRDVYPDIFGTMLVPKAPELIASPYRHGGKEAANQHFESGMLQTFRNIRRFITPDYPLTVYYAFKQQDAEVEEDDKEDRPHPAARDPHPKSLPHQEGGTFTSLPSELGEGSGMGAFLPSELGEGSGMGAFLPSELGEGSGVRGARASTGWETMLASLIAAGFSIDGTWPMRTELSNRMVGMGANALASSIVLVCRPRPEDAPTTSRRAFLDALRRELPAALKAMQSGSIAPVDLAQASIGPGMAIYSRYSKVLESDGSPMSVRTALGLINAALDEYLAEQDGDIDADTRFAVAWFEQFGFNEGEFGRADVLARAKNTSVAGVEAAGLVVSGRGKVRLVHWKEYDPANSPHPASLPQNEGGTLPPSLPRGGKAGDGGWDPTQDKRATIWEATHHLIERLNTHGETGSARLMQKMPPEMAAEARNLAYRLYNICERKGWADHARDYNALVISWSEIGEEAARLRDAAARGEATNQPRLFDDA